MLFKYNAIGFKSILLTITTIFRNYRNILNYAHLFLSGEVSYEGEDDMSKMQ